MKAVFQMKKISFYKSLLGFPDLNCSGGDLVAIQSLLIRFVSTDFHGQLVHVVTDEEIFNVP